jgi:hypothetical protein
LYHPSKFSFFPGKEVFFQEKCKGWSMEVFESVLRQGTTALG